METHEYSLYGSHPLSQSSSCSISDDDDHTVDRKTSLDISISILSLSEDHSLISSKVQVICHLQGHSLGGSGS
ncbi:hypothetical protein CsSME_00047354 [Camellia sinensis var. sinensis]